MTTTAMIVMEPGSDWPGQVGDATNLVAFGHGCDDLLRRTQVELSALQRSRQVIRVAVLACNAATGSVASVRRAQLARALLGAVATTNSGRLVLTASGQASPSLLQELLALAETLADELRGTSVTVSLRFADAPHARVGPTR
jgi:ABC-type transporter Mla subunit MlaD